MIKTISYIKNVRFCHLNNFDQSISVAAKIYKADLKWENVKVQVGQFCRSADSNDISIGKIKNLN